MRLLLDTFGSAERAMTADVEELIAAGASLKAAQEIVGGTTLSQAESILDHCEHAGIRVLTRGEADFPQAFALVKHRLHKPLLLVR